MNLVKVIFPYKWSKGYTYKGVAIEGAIVAAQVKNRTLWGVVTGAGEAVQDPKSLIHIIPHPLTKNFMLFIYKAAEYNMWPTGKAFDAVIRKWSNTPSWYIWENEICSVARVISQIGKRKFDQMHKEGKLKEVDKLPKTVEILLDEAQEACFSKIHLTKPVLLKGDTGSGKTNIYFKIVSRFIDGQCLIMLPEVALTDQFMRRIFENFGFWPHVWHHKVSPAAKDIIWSWALSGKQGIVLGSRSALWLPFSNLKIIVIDEEHDDSFKQDQDPIYNCRDMAVLRASIEKLPIILVSATPSLETWYNVKKGKYTMAEVASTKSYSARIVKRSCREWLTTESKYAIAKTIEAGGQSFLFLNRRGFASNLFCTTCSNVLLCKYCSASLIIYKNLQTKCSYCAYTSVVKPCGVCNSNTWQMYGIGIEKVYEELQTMFPKVKIRALSSDSSEIYKHVEDIYNNEIQIIIATQILSKGHHFPNLKLIVILQGDHGMASGDPRNTERIYQLLTQVKGRFGTNNDQNLAIIQSTNPESLLIQAIAKNKFTEWAEQELLLREKYKLPPFCCLIRIIVAAKTFEDSYTDAYYLYNQILVLKNVKIYQPAPTQLYKYKGTIRHYIIISYSNSYPQKEILKIMQNLVLPKKSKIFVDADPRAFF